MLWLMKKVEITKALFIDVLFSLDDLDGLVPSVADFTEYGAGYLAGDCHPQGKG